jgi:hypothetical protein
MSAWSSVLGESRRVSVNPPITAKSDIWPTSGPPFKFCWLERFGQMENGDPMPPCSGELIRAHLIPRQLLLRTVPAERSAEIVNDSRGWVWACGGPMGNAGHHGMFDQARTLRVPRISIPVATEEMAEELHLVWWLDRTYGERR